MNNSTQNYYGQGVHGSTKIILYSIVLVWSLVGNVLVIAVVVADKSMRTRFNYLIINMAISDLAVPLVAMPLMIVEEIRAGEWAVSGSFGNALCKLSYVITAVSPAVSVFSLVVIAANRFFAIVYPMRLKMVSKKKLLYVIALTWIISIVIFAPQLYSFQIITINGMTRCGTSWKPLSRYAFYSIFVIVLFFIPFTAIIVLYSIMLYKIRKMSEGLENMVNDEEARSRERQNRHIFYLTVVVIVVFALFWGPFFSWVFVLNFIWQFDVPENVQPYFHTVLFVLQFLGFLNSAINPCVYFLLMKRYREGLKKLFRCEEHRDTPTEMSHKHLNTKVSLAADNSGHRLIKFDNTQV